MSQSDSFIQEVTEEVRRDRMFRLWRRYGAYVVGAIVLVVAAGAFRAWYERNQEEQAQARMGEYLAIAEGGADEESTAALESFAAESDDGYALLAKFRAAAAHLEAGESERAAEIYRSLADEPSLPAVYRDLAALQSALVATTEMEASARITTLRPLAEGTNLYRSLAQELLAGALLESGDAAAALELYDTLLDAPETSPSMRFRIEPLQEAAQTELDRAG